jgi:hypothetical protein
VSSSKEPPESVDDREAGARIPALTGEGVLPPGLHPCTVDDIDEQFGRFQSTERRIQLTQRLREFIDLARRMDVVVWIAVDGSYVTDKSDPNDIDLVIVLRSDHDYQAELSPAEYNMLSKRRVRAKFPFDILVAPDNSDLLREHLEFFQRTRDGRPKGILKVAV